MNIRGSRNTIVVLIAVLIAGSCIVGTASAHFAMLFPGGSMDVAPEDYIASLGEEKTVLITGGAHSRNCSTVLMSRRYM
ncbi:hypothetical protein C5S39_02275 [Candidatus Methanophagaceae archaeon]|nr:hypothetical protein C5S39_02275 [Methanophagales archaeon]